jgi:hypothetical protein
VTAGTIFHRSRECRREVVPGYRHQTLSSRRGGGDDDRDGGCGPDEGGTSRGVAAVEDEDASNWYPEAASR